MKDMYTARGKGPFRTAISGITGYGSSGQRKYHVGMNILRNVESCYYFATLRWTVGSTQLVEQ